FNQHFYSAIWLRVQLDDSIYDKKFQTLSRLNKNFRPEIKKTLAGGVSVHHETLFQYYRESISFDVSSTLRELLYGNEDRNRFSTYEINLYDGDTLIAAGFFDMGEKTAAGITCIYHPAYKKNSLGKYLMYLKMDFCRRQQMHFFYPGYIVPGYKAFDYKMEIGKKTLQYFQLSTQQWVPYTPSSIALTPLQEMVDKLTALQSFLAKNEIPNAILHYRYFEINLDPYYHGERLFDYPVFLNCFPLADASFYSMIVYDVRNCHYCFLQCSAVINITQEKEARTVFDTNLLKITRQLFATSVAEEMSSYLSGFLKSV
ncbi:MAG: hypothetical protein ABIS01_17700, partial [Ferruginibacter sp.]